ncbi:hypothetical protein J132_04022 [Termitomyces sp. J132]|nr:hypothetical protein J132_04022 [Termitomyces sp. J132]
MPKQVEDLLEKIIRNFFWNSESKPTIGLNILRCPQEKGGRKLLDIRVRNKVIEIMKAKRYLNLGPECPR